ncbi:hypothetical protein [Paenibacillus sp. NPDC058071]
MGNTNKKIAAWKSKMDTYYKSTSKKKLIKDLVKAGFKVKR